MIDVATLFNLLIGILVTLALGSYAYTFILGRDIRKELARLWTRLTNHYEHRMMDVERRLNTLEKKH